MDDYRAASIVRIPRKGINIDGTRYLGYCVCFQGRTGPTDLVYDKGMLCCFTDARGAIPASSFETGLLTVKDKNEALCKPFRRLMNGSLAEVACSRCFIQRNDSGLALIDEGT